MPLVIRALFDILDYLGITWWVDNLTFDLIFAGNCINMKEISTGQTRLIRSHSSARLCFELSGKFELTVHLNMK